MRSGALRHRITIEQSIDEKDTYGGRTKRWEKFATVWGAIEPLAGREYFAAKQEGAEVSHRIKIRFLNGVLPDMRVTFDDRVFEIDSVLNLGERGKEIHIMATETVS